MATACLFVGWNRPHIGQDKQAYSYLMGEGMERLQQWKKEGKIENVRHYGLTAHGGDLNGCVLLEGERAKLDELRRTDDFERFSMRMSQLFDRYGVVPGVTEEGIRKVMERNPELTK